MYGNLFRARALFVLSGAITCGFFVLPARAQSIVKLGVYSTGQSSVYSAATQTQFASGVADTPWTILSNPSGTTAATALVTNPHPLWIANTGSSKWISDAADSSTAVDAVGNFDYQTTFNIPTNVILSSVQIVYSMACDNSVTSVLFNGVSTGATWNNFSSFSGSQTINSSNATFHTGTNTIDFIVNNGTGGSPNPSGLNVAFTSATGSAAPEPGSVALLTLGAAMVGGRGLRRKSRIKST